ncbi:hypothetical protein [Cellulomonas biazotea]|uniref:Uncharacterized protein n=1 Tax=Cellulomonas biazotea TaxID=1709 RepID=A0A402DT63_9CELL|nr:hypothetical protein [Cellulomonas biazotea]GCE77321.1 hypothetical protein CBZ_23770 [Cellulomonas biazotea]
MRWRRAGGTGGGLGRRALAAFDVRPLVALVVAVVVAWAGGFSTSSALLVGLAVAAAVVVLTRIDVAAEPRGDTSRPVRRHGARGEIQELTWAMVGRDRRIGERVLRRVRDVGAVRLARHGLVLGAPDDDAAVLALVGPRAHATLTRRSSPLPTVADVRHTVDVLYALGPHRAADVAVGAGPAGDARPADVRPADVRPADVRPADVRPADVRPADVRPADVRPADPARPTDPGSPRR